jgi:hypothetical protein
MLRAIHEREGRWDEVDPDTEVARIGNEIGLSEDQSYELFGHLVDEGFLDAGRAYRAGGAMPGSISRIVGREENMTVIGDDVRLTSKGEPRSSDSTCPVTRAVSYHLRLCRPTMGRRSPEGRLPP